jgi:PucR C-terminal helix-turn-helix domain
VTRALAPTCAVSKRRPPARLESTVRVSRAYRPCLLSWAGSQPVDAPIEQMRRTARECDRSSLLISLDEATQILLLAEDPPDRPNVEHVGDTVHSIVDAARALRPQARIQAVVGDRIPPGERLSIAASSLRRIARRARARPGDDLIWVRRHSLAALLETIEPRQAAVFVEERLVSLRAYDRVHGTDLQRVLELALDHPNRNAAASAAFMHRNTFRRQLRRALELAGVDLDDPDERLALHVALKLRGRRAPARPVRRPQNASSSSSSRIANTHAVPMPSTMATQPVTRAIGRSSVSSRKNRPHRTAQANQSTPR